MTQQIIVDMEALRLFLVEAHRHGYGSKDESKWVKESDGSTSITYESEDGCWRYKDHFYGGEPYAGTEVIFFEGRAVWASSYKGEVWEGEDKEQVYELLKEALRASSEDFPVRGPHQLFLSKRLTTYTCRANGTWRNFELKEEIDHRGRCIYRARFVGGLINLR